MIQDTTDYHSAQIRMICNQMYERSMEDLTNRFLCCIFVSRVRQEVVQVIVQHHV